MFTKRYLIVLLAVVVTVAACTPKSVLPASTSTPFPQPTATPGVSCPCFEGLSSGLDNAAQARIRTVSEVMGAPDTDVYVNGMPALNGGVAEGNIGAGQFSGWLYVTPGTYTVTLVPHGGTMDQALFPAADVKVEAGHRYTVAAMGQLADKDVHPLVVDETALEADLGAGVTDTITIDINNMTGADSLSEQAYGKTQAADIKYGEARAWFMASGNPKFALQVTVGGTTQTAWEGSGWAEPGMSVGLPWFGPFPAPNYDSVGNTSQGTSELNVVDFIAGFTGRGIRMDTIQYDFHPIEFTTFLKVIEKSGLRDQLLNSGPYFLLAPTDAAFATLPQADLDALLNDPQTAVQFLNAHIVDGYYPSGSLSGQVYGTANRTLTNRLGASLVFANDTLNYHDIGTNYTVGNGIRLQIIYTPLPFK